MPFGTHAYAVARERKRFYSVGGVLGGDVKWSCSQDLELHSVAKGAVPYLHIGMSLGQ